MTELIRINLKSLSVINQRASRRQNYAAEILQASHKMEEYCGSLIDYAKTFQIDSNQFSQLSLGDFLAYLQDDWGTVQQTGKLSFLSPRRL